MNLDALKLALEASPDNVPLLLLIARELEDSFDLDEALEYLHRALEVEPNHADVLLSQARLLDLQGKTSESILRTESLCQIHPHHAEAWMLRARLALKDNNAQDARDFYQQGVDLNPELKDDDLLSRIIRAGGASVRKKVSVAHDGRIQEDDEWESEVHNMEGLDAVWARDLKLEFGVKADITFADVGGMEAVKEDIRMKILYPMQNPDLFAAYGKKAGGGVLMYGPPGCGKTLLSRATAGEIKANFFCVGLHQVLGSFVGESEDKMHKIFELARRHAPAVLFFDEIDALAADRKDMRQSAGKGVINQFLEELDGAQSDNDGVLILGATNAPWHLDSAFLRPGRFDQMVFVSPPDAEAREEIAKIHAKEKPVVGMDAGSLAKRTEGFSGADLRAVFDRATESTLAEAMKKGKVIPISQKDLVKSVKQVKPSTRSWFESAKNYALYANQSGFYDDVLNYLGIKK